MYICVRMQSWRTTFKSQFCPSTIWVSGIELRLSSLAAGTPAEPSHQPRVALPKPVFMR